MTAPLSKEHTDRILDEARNRIAKNAGVSLVQDFNGAWGEAGAIYLTIRFHMGSDMVQVHTKVKDISSSLADDEYERHLREDK